MANVKRIDLTAVFDGSVYVVVKDALPVGVCKHYGMALSLAGEFGATGIHRTMEGVWQSAPNAVGSFIFIYRMGVRGS